MRHAFKKISSYASERILNYFVVIFYPQMALIYGREIYLALGASTSKISQPLPLLRSLGRAKSWQRQLTDRRNVSRTLRVSSSWASKKKTSFFFSIFRIKLWFVYSFLL